MKLRTLLLIGAGIAIGYKLATKAKEDDADVVAGPRREQPSGLTAAPGLRVITGQAQRLADQATTRSLDAIRSARGAIRSRLGDDDAAWN